MCKPNSQVDALRHVRFAGRPAIAISRFSKRINPNSTTGKYDKVCMVEQHNEFISWVLEHACLTADSYRSEPLNRRIAACLRALHVTTEAHARLKLEQHPELLPTAIGALLIGVTEFFRDPSVFEILRTEILPQLASSARPLRVWSAGCSNGAELYSLAILLDQIGRLDGSFLLGTDCRLDAVEQARTALYASTELQNVSKSDRCRYFEGTGSSRQVTELLRRHVQWKVTDLVSGVEGGPWDIILWRNMAIYLKSEAAESVWHGLTSALSPDGALITGKAERPPAKLPLIKVKNCIYRLSSCCGRIIRKRSKQTNSG